MAPPILKACLAILLAAAPASTSSIDLARRHAALNATYKDPTASVDARVADLLSRMTLEEKTAQLVQGDFSNWINTTSNGFNASGLAWNMAHRAGQFYVGYAVPPPWIAAGVKLAQDYLLHNTTLGIPAFVQTEGIHGLLISSATVFNSPIGQACSWNPSLIASMARIIGTESRAIGVNQIFAPLADLARELRFGRVEETYGEDPHLVGEMAYSYVVGIQGVNVSATVKHFAAFSAPEQGLNTGPVHGGERELRTTWLPSFRRAIVDAGAHSIMGSYNSYDGVPTVADAHLMTDILRGEWGYKYWVTSDAGATDRLCCQFRMCACEPVASGKPKVDSEAITLLALPAGNDVEMGGGSFSFENIPRLVAEGKLDVDVVDTAVARQLRAKFALGLFENPYPGVDLAASNGTNGTYPAMQTKEAMDVALQLDEESIVLLENKNQTLPLKRDAKVAVIGAFADMINFGDYVVSRAQYAPNNISPLQGLRSLSNGSISYAQGCLPWSNSESDIPAAVAAASAADVAVVFLGTWSRDQGELWTGANATTGEHIDLSSLSPVGAQLPLLSALLSSRTPVILILQSGKPLTLPPSLLSSPNLSAVLQQFYPGAPGGLALARVLFGLANPSGKLSVSIPRSTGSLPVYYDYLNSGRWAGGTEGRDSGGEVYANGTMRFGASYALGSATPRWGFGHGLSYSEFEYGAVRLDRGRVRAGEKVRATVEVTNKSGREGMEVVQVYVRDVLASVAVPNLQLRGFKKVSVKAGETVEVSVEMDTSEWGVWGSGMKYKVEKGEFVVFVGASSGDLRTNATVVVE